MSAHHHLTTITDPGPLHAPRLRNTAIALLIIGILGFIAALFGAFDGGSRRAWSSLLQGMMIPTFITFGAIFFIAVNWLVGSVWIVPLRRLMEGLTTGLPLTAIAFFLIVIIGGRELYPWIATSYMGGDADAHSYLFYMPGGSKEAYMTWSRFALVNGLFIAVWFVLRDRLIQGSIRQDQVGGDQREQQTPWAIAWLMVFAITSTFFVWDLLLALHVNWFSTMWGVYAFASMVQMFFCVILLLMVWLRRGPMKEVVPKHILHDMSTWMLGWSCFCAYISFSQFMLIYYANMDKGVFYYASRTQNGYGLQLWIESILRWPVPFLLLMSQSRRTCPITITIVSILVLIGNWLTLSWIIVPAFSPDSYQSTFFGPELLVGAGFVGAFLLLALNFWRRYGLVAKGDPRLLRAVNAEHLH
ncbi:MAG: hypothetical protein EA401_11990 [Planctomycetota bacterium]|nr:MAG: hypothetical protein EA401_11990 [Planctomycetota bacterium]